MVKILTVLVLYRCSLQNCAAWHSMQSQVLPEPFSLTDFALLVCLNDPAMDDPAIHTKSFIDAGVYGRVQVAAAAGNHGLAWAYDHALSMARREGFDWLLTLDQDADLPADFLAHMLARAVTCSGQQEVGAIVPRLVSRSGKALSPVIIGRLREHPVPSGVQGIVTGDVRAYNSGALVRVTALTAIGGYDRRFWLDYLDHAVFRGLYERGFQVWVEGELAVRHTLSLQDGREAMSEERFRNFSEAEAAFRDLHGSGWARLFYLGRLVIRLFNQKRRKDPAHFSRTTLRLMRERLFQSRHERLRRWENSVAAAARMPEILASRAPLQEDKA